MSGINISLDDKYDLNKRQIFVTGAQAIIRMLMMQAERDRQAGLNTAGFVSGYRGSPLGGLDLQLWQANNQLADAGVRFQAGLNEELAATACWGTQQAELDGEGKHDGVFALWYGKGPGVDRSTDVLRHANVAGSSRNGGVLALMGDDHMAESSSIAHQTEFNFVDTLTPILHPAGVQELIDYGLYGYALSRFAGTWTALKCVKDNIESTASVDAALDRISIIEPEFDMPPGGLNIRREIDFLGQEWRLHRYKRYAAEAFVRANNMNKIIFSGGSHPKIGIMSIGKSYLETRQALEDLGIDEAHANQLGIRLSKIACPWPLDTQHVREFAHGLDLLIVIEEKRSLIELQVKEALYGTADQPLVIGKRDERGDHLFPVEGALDPAMIAIAVGDRIRERIGEHEQIEAVTNRLHQFQALEATRADVATRTPYYCSGCPHNTSTKVPEGGKAAAGIGCHFMALWMDRNTAGFTAMGGEGAQWVGESLFSTRDHIFQNLGDGTYTHSGSLAIRFAKSADTNITFKILYNDAVAMTGGQPLEGGLTVDQIATQVRAEGVERIAIVTDEPEKYDHGYQFPPLVSIDHRHQLDKVQRELQATRGVSVLIYDQTCAAEKRRRRKRGTYPDPDKRIMINELVCEGCGDCGVKSNCVSIQPIETTLGRKRRIDQSNCNKDFSCLDGFCPAFVTVHGAKRRRLQGISKDIDPLDGVPEPQLPNLDQGWAAIVNGVGGTGVVTIGAVLGMAAHLEGKGCGMIDMAGLAQKGGAVYSHLRIANSPQEIHAIRVPAGKADTILGGDLVVSGSAKILSATRTDHTLFVANTAQIMPGEFTRDRNFELPMARLQQEIIKTAGPDNCHFFDARKAARALFGNAVSANIFITGFAFQKGGIPVSAQSIEKAIELNGQAVKMNTAAFRWGRRAAHDPQTVLDLVATQTQEKLPQQDVHQIIAQRTAFLTDYQDQAYADHFQKLVKKVEMAEQDASGKSGSLTETVARNLFRLMAVKDEYEVARLYTDGSFARSLAREFESFDRLEFHLAAPLLSSTGQDVKPRKRTYGRWMLSLFGLLSKFKRLRGTTFDVFGYQAERRMEQSLRTKYENDIQQIINAASTGNLGQAQELANWPAEIKGFGHVKQKAAKFALEQRDKALNTLALKQASTHKDAA